MQREHKGSDDAKRIDPDRDGRTGTRGRAPAIIVVAAQPSISQ